MENKNYMELPAVGQLVQILIATAKNMSPLWRGYSSIDDHFQKKKQNRLKFREITFTYHFENTLQETRHVWKWN